MQFTDKTWRLIRPVDANTAEAVAAALDAVAIAGLELAAAQKELDAAERKLASTSDAQAAAVADASARLRGELAKRAQAGKRYEVELLKKVAEVSELFPELKNTTYGQFAAFELARGAVKIGDEVADFTPATTDANAAAVATFKPVLRDAPDTNALRAVKVREAVALFRRLDAARARHKAAQQALHDALAVSADMIDALDGELDREEQSIADAVAAQAADAADAANDVQGNAPPTAGDTPTTP